MSSILSTTGLVKRFQHVPVLDGLDFAVPEGSVYGLVGSNGVGKSTTLKILLNIIQPTAGRADVLGVDSRQIGPAQLACIGYVSENQTLPGWMTVGYLLQYLKPFYDTWDDSRATELMRQFDLPLDRKLKHLSRGMRMKAALASSLAYHPKLLVLDEPFSGLDPVVRDELISSLLDCASETTILICSHDLAEIESFASHVGYLNQNGRLQFSEEMAGLAARFREIEVAAKSPVGPNDPDWPSHWVRPETSTALVRFVETRFDPERTISQIRRTFGDTGQISIHPMPLRTIFVTLARS